MSLRVTTGILQTPGLLPPPEGRAKEAPKCPPVLTRTGLTTNSEEQTSHPSAGGRGEKECLLANFRMSEWNIKEPWGHLGGVTGYSGTPPALSGRKMTQQGDSPDETALLLPPKFPFAFLNSLLLPYRHPLTPFQCVWGHEEATGFLGVLSGLSCAPKEDCFTPRPEPCSHVPVTQVSFIPFGRTSGHAELPRPGLELVHPAVGVQS